MIDMPRRVASPVFVGRADELDRVIAGLRGAVNREATTFLVGGEAGVGKTRFVEESAAHARGMGFRVVAGGCIQLAEGTLPYAPIVEALRPLPDEVPPPLLDALLARDRSELARLMPRLATAEAAPATIGQFPQARLFELLLGFLTRLSEEHPLFWIVEDLHWADRSTLDLLTVAARGLRGSRVVLVGTFRTDELHRRHPLLPVLAELERSALVERIDLRCFDRAELDNQLGAILRAKPDGDLVERVWARSAGNPFYAEELLAAGPEDGPLPATLRDILLARLSAVNEPTRELLRVASAGGVRISVPVLAAVMGAVEADLVPALREAVGRDLLVGVDVPGLETFMFRHALMQEALEAELMPGERARLHAAYAAALESVGDPADSSRPAQLAHHWYRAHDLRQALKASVDAGLAAERSLAFAEAQIQFDRALELWDRVPAADAESPIDRISLLEHAAWAADLIGDPVRAIAHVQAALDFVDEAADPVRAGMLHERLGHYRSDAAESQASISACRRALELIPPDPPSALRARALLELGHCLYLADRYPEAGRLYDEAVRVARLVEAREIEVEARLRRADLRCDLGDLEQADADAREARDVALRLGQAEAVSLANFVRVHVLWFTDRREEAIAVCREAFRHAEAHGLVRASRVSGTVFLGGAAYMLYSLGRWDEAARLLDQARLLGADAETQPFMYHLTSSELAIARGQFDEAERLLERLRGLTEHAGPHTAVGLGRRQAELAIWRHDPLRARQAVDAALGSAPVGLAQGPFDEAPTLSTLGVRAEADLASQLRARRELGDLDEARRRATALIGLVEAAQAAAVAKHATLTAAWTGACVALCRGELTRLEGRPDPSAWSKAATAWEALRAPYEHAYVLYREAEARAIGGSRAEVARGVREAHALARSLGASLLLDEIVRLAARTGIDLETDGEGLPTPGPAYGLTPREREVLALVVAGRTNRQIGEALFISEKTASVHVSNILGKLGVSGRTEAAAVAEREGLLTAGETGSSDR